MAEIRLRTIHFHWAFLFNQFFIRKDMLSAVFVAVVLCGELIGVKGYTKEDVCYMDPDFGGCGAFTQRYYFNRFTGDCHEFVFGGCLGNNNNFESMELCREYCEGFELDKKQSCSKPKERGPCEGFIWRYYFDESKRECETFVYGGCRGNENNFRTKKECANTCGTLED